MEKKKKNTWDVQICSKVSSPKFAFKWFVELNFALRFNDLTSAGLGVESSKPTQGRVIKGPFK